MARSYLMRFTRARRKRLGLVIIVCAILTVPVAYDSWFIANFGLDARVFRDAPPGYAVVLLLQPDTLWKLWVHYWSPFNNSGSESLDTMISAIGVGDSWGVPAQPYMISRTAGTSVNVLFSFSWSNWTPKPHGFFWLRISEICKPIPVAIGLSASQVNASDFPGLDIAPYCPAESFYATIQAYSGMELAYIQTNLNLRYPTDANLGDLRF